MECVQPWPGGQAHVEARPARLAGAKIPPAARLEASLRRPEHPHCKWQLEQPSAPTIPPEDGFQTMAVAVRLPAFLPTSDIRLRLAAVLAPKREP